MTTPPEDWRAQLEPAAWLTCRVTQGQPPRDWEGRRVDDLDWVRAEPADPDPTDASLTIMAGWGGGGKYHHTEVIEAQPAVYVLVFIEHRVPAVPKPGVMYVRTLELRRAIIEVDLTAALGGRALLGSVGSSSSWGSMSYPADSQPIDTVRSRPRSEASAQANDLIAKFDQLHLIQTTHEALTYMQADCHQDAEG